jgi:divalent metal cation (Fe/Co/Zn/Cd) transporter
MDTALPPDEQRVVADILERYHSEGVQYHALRTRRAGARRFIDFHVLVPGAWTVQQGHDLLERIEADIRGQLANTTILTHLEPVEDAVSWCDTALDRVHPSDRQET